MGMMRRGFLSLGVKPGTLPWLLNHELRLWWRDLRAKWFLLIMGILSGIVIVAIALLWFLVNRFAEQPLPQFPNPIPLSFLRIGGGVLLFLFIYSFMQAMQQSLAALFDRGDLDLLVSSPIPPKTIFASRLLGVAIEVFLSFLTLVIPISLAFMLIGWFQLLAIYPALMMLCLLSTSGSMLLALWLVRLIGAKRARTVAQVFTMAIAAAFFIGMQLINLSMQRDAQQSGELVLPGNSEILETFGAESWIWVPVKAMFFDIPSLGAMLLISGGLVWLTVEMLNRQFIEGTQQSVTTKRSPISVKRSAFRQGLTPVFLAKEWRIILRSPYLVSRTLLSIVFLIPLMIWVIYGQNPNAGIDIEGIATIALPISGAFLTSSLGVICIAGEEAPDLIKLSPVKGQRIRLLKLLAILLPVWGVLGLFFLVMISQGVNVIPGVFLVLFSTSCSALIRLWNARPISLAGMMMRQRENAFNDTVLGIFESMLFFVWIALGTQVRSGNYGVAGFIVLIVGMMMAIAYWRSRALGSSLGF